MAATWPCRCGRLTSSMERRAAPSQTTSIAVPCSPSLTPAVSTLSAPRDALPCRRSSCIRKKRSRRPWRASSSPACACRTKSCGCSQRDRLTSTTTRISSGPLPMRSRNSSGVTRSRMVVVETLAFQASFDDEPHAKLPRRQFDCWIAKRICEHHRRHQARQRAIDVRPFFQRGKVSRACRDLIEPPLQHGRREATPFDRGGIEQDLRHLLELHADQRRLAFHERRLRCLFQQSISKRRDAKSRIGCLGEELFVGDAVAEIEYHELRGAASA